MTWLLWEKIRKLYHHFYLQHLVSTTSLALFLQTVWEAVTAIHDNGSNPSKRMTIEEKEQFSQESVNYWSEETHELPPGRKVSTILYYVLQTTLWDNIFLLSTLSNFTMVVVNLVLCYTIYTFAIGFSIGHSKAFANDAENSFCFCSSPFVSHSKSTHWQITTVQD